MQPTSSDQALGATKPVRWAADTVATMREGARLCLDYSAQSLWRVDRLIEDIRREGAPYAAVDSVLRGFGAYAGEVIVRQTGAEWWETGGEYWLRTPGRAAVGPGRRGPPLLRRATARCDCCAGRPRTGVGGDVCESEHHRRAP